MAVDIVCMRIGELFSWDYVVRLRNAVMRHPPDDMGRVWCVTREMPALPHGINFIWSPKETGKLKPRAVKVSLLSGEYPFSDPFLYLDLETLVLDSLQPYFDHEPGVDFVGNANWANRQRKPGLASGVMRIGDSDYNRQLYHIAMRYLSDRPCKDDDQRILGNLFSPIYFPNDWTWSYKWGRYLGDPDHEVGQPPPAGTKLAQWHGHPMLHESAEKIDWVSEAWV